MNIKAVILVLVFVFAILLIQSLYLSAMDEKIDEKTGKMEKTGEIKWTSKIDESGLPEFDPLERSVLVRSYETKNELAWIGLKNVRIVYVPDEVFVNLTEGTKEEEVEIKIRFNNATITRDLAPLSSRGLIEKMGVTLKSSIELKEGDLIVEGKKIEAKGLPAWYDLPGWFSYIWGIFAPIITFDIFGKVKTGLPAWMQTAIQAFIVVTVYGFAVLVIANFVRGTK